MERYLHKFYLIQFDMHLNFFWHFVAIPNAFALMFSPLKISAFFLRDAKNPDVDLENLHTFYLIQFDMHLNLFFFCIL